MSLEISERNFEEAIEAVLLGAGRLVSAERASEVVKATAAQVQINFLSITAISKDHERRL